MTVIKRAQLEVDRTLRSRSFFARALGGYLEPPEYADLLSQLGGLAVITAGPSGDRLGRCHQQDLIEFEYGGPASPDCPTLTLMKAACRSWERFLTPEERRAASVGMLGTSWTLEACERLGERFDGATTLLQELGSQGPTSVQALSRRAKPFRPEVLAAAELVGGALLSIATYLETRWPAPISLISI